MRGHCAICKIQRKRAIRHKHRTAFFVLQSTRGRSVQVRSILSRERVKGRSPLRSPEAAPLAGVRGSATWSPSINTRKKYERALNSIAKWVSRGSKTLRGCRAAPCRSPEAAPLVGVRGKAPRLPLPQNLLNFRFFLVCQRHMLLHRLHVLENLRGAACAGNHGRNRRVFQHPRQR